MLAACIIDIRFMRLASVGLTVLAPRPVAWEDESGIPGMIDMRFAEDGVAVPLPFARPGDLPAYEEDLLCSGVIEGVERYVGRCVAGGCSDFVLAARAVAKRAPSVAALPEDPKDVLPI